MVDKKLAKQIAENWSASEDSAMNKFATGGELDVEKVRKEIATAFENAAILKQRHRMANGPDTRPLYDLETYLHFVEKGDSK